MARSRRSCRSRSTATSVGRGGPLLPVRGQRLDHPPGHSTARARPAADRGVQPSRPRRLQAQPVEARQDRRVAQGTAGAVRARPTRRRHSSSSMRPCCAGPSVERRPCAARSTISSRCRDVPGSRSRSCLSPSARIRRMQGPFVHLEFPAENDPDVIFVENTLGDTLFRDDPDITAEYREQFWDSKILPHLRSSSSRSRKLRRRSAAPQSPSSDLQCCICEMVASYRRSRSWPGSHNSCMTGLLPTITGSWQVSARQP